MTSPDATPRDRRPGDVRAARYLLGVIDLDTEAQMAALKEIDTGMDLWDLTDALGALVRTTFSDLGVTDAAVVLIRRRLLDAALVEGER